MSVNLIPDGPFANAINQFSSSQLELEQARVRSQIAQLTTLDQLLELAISIRRASEPAGQLSTSRGKPVARGTSILRPPQIVGRPTLKTAILLVMSEGAPGYEWSPTAVHEELTKRGWAPETASARSQISNRLQDLVKTGQIIKPAQGRYMLAAATNESDGTTGLFAPAGSGEG